MTDDTTTRTPRPAALALADAFDRSMTRDDLRDLTDTDLSRFGSLLQHWQELARHERYRRTTP